MEHGEWLELVSAHADGELTAREAETLASHLDVCAACRDQLEVFERARRRARMHEPAGQPRLVEEILASRDLDRTTAGTRPVPLRRAALAAAAAAAAVVVALILVPGGDAPSRDVASRHVADARISAGAGAFDRSELEVEAGATVEWRNTSSKDHRLVRELGAVTLDQALPPGATEAATFDEPGTFAYYCEVHPAMSGTVTVKG